MSGGPHRPGRAAGPAALLAGLLVAGLTAASACGRYGPPVRPAAVARVEPGERPAPDVPTGSAEQPAERDPERDEPSGSR